MGYGIDILNNIRGNASEEYQNRIPEATRENITAIGNALQTWTIVRNEFCNALFNRIGKTILEQKLFKNKLARFKSGTVTDGKDVEEIFIEMAKSEGAYDIDGSNPLGRRAWDGVNTIYHRMNRQDKYVVSIGDMDFVRAFQSEATLESFIKGRINAVYSGASYDEWLAMKNLIGTYDGYFEVLCPVITYDPELEKHLVYAFYDKDPVNAATYVESFDNHAMAMKHLATDFLRRVRKVVEDMSFPSAKFNKAGVMTWTNPEDCVLLLNKDLVTEIDVNVLADTFHLEKKSIPTTVISMDDFGSLEDVYAVLVDKEWFKVFDVLSHMEPQRNADGLFTNYFYHVWQILSCSPFKNAVVFKKHPDGVSVI